VSRRVSLRSCPLIKSRKMRSAEYMEGWHTWGSPLSPELELAHSLRCPCLGVWPGHFDCT
jgi:hypothetical protein